MPRVSMQVDLCHVHKVKGGHSHVKVQLDSNSRLFLLTKGVSLSLSYPFFLLFYSQKFCRQFNQKQLKTLDL